MATTSSTRAETSVVYAARAVQGIVLAALAAALAGGVIAFYQLGYRIAAFRVGLLLDHDVRLSTVDGIAGASPWR